jgi:thiol-disulfide isomerase/thioredoxin
MKKYYLILFLAVLTATVVAQNKKKTDYYLLSGSIENTKDGDVIYWEKLGLLNATIDSAVIKDGKFSIKFKPVRKDIETCLRWGKYKRFGIPFVMENSNIKIQIPKDKRLSIIKGGYENDLYSTYNKQINEFNTKLYKEEGISNDTTRTAQEREIATKNYCNLRRGKNLYTSSFIRTNMPSSISILLLDQKMENFSNATLDSILKVMKVKCPKEELYIKLSKMRDEDKRTEVGHKYIDFIMNDINGNPLKLSDLVKSNKLTIIDFWASWCGSCKAEMPDVIKVYNKYKNQGVGILGVTLDNDANAWKLSTKIVGIPWQQVFDMKGPMNKAAVLYSIRSIPATIIINQKGTIVARNIRGEYLESKIKELLENKGQ